MGVHFATGYILDLHHLFVGLDALPHRNPKPQILTRAKLLYASQTEYDYGTMPDDFQYKILDNAHASLWAGDTGAVYTFISHNLHKSYEADWKVDHPTEKGNFAIHYFKGLAPDHDLLADVIAYRLSDIIARRVKNQFPPFVTTSDIIISALQQMQRDLICRGAGDYFNYFGNDLKDGYSNDDVIKWIEDCIINFTEIFEIQKRHDTKITATDRTNFSQAIRVKGDDNNKINEDAVATQFIRWLQSKSSLKLLPPPTP
ncbi:MAG: hypothetical protein GY869_06485 [Planctomycetes bacterium]|nr:hypothetical protein [Planctomycetota bacterium]